MKTLHIEYYAALREARGLSCESMESDAATPSALYASLRQAHGFRLHADQLRVVVNETFSDWDTPLNTGDTVVFIPPVAGG
jgi:molybdopterin converting factor small subunit